jgi:hypothetical protein
MTLARTLGVLGILSTLALAIWAFGGARRGAEKLEGPPDPALLRSTPGAVLDEAHTREPLPSAQAVTVVPVPEERSQPGGPTHGSNEPQEATSTAREPPHRAPRAAQVPGAREPRPGAAPALTQEEIRRRKEQYDRWLREQGLQRLDEVVVPSPSEAPANESGE